MRLHRATAGNPLAPLELATDASDPALAPEGAPVLVSARISRAFLRRAGMLDEPARRALVRLRRPATAAICRSWVWRQRGSVSTSRRWSRRRTSGSSGCERAWSSSATHWPARLCTRTRRSIRGATRTGRLPPRCPTGTSTVEPGISPRPRPAPTRRHRRRSSRRGLAAAIAALRDRGSGVRAGGAARGRH
jgi:hypothetical protein